MSMGYQEGRLCSTSITLIISEYVNEMRYVARLHQRVSFERKESWAISAIR